jgi:hypothetical protein
LHCDKNVNILHKRTARGLNRQQCRLRIPQR